MAKINLLPWRQERRKEQQRQFFTLMGLSAVLVVLLLLAVYLEFTRQISKQQQRNQYLKAYSQKLDDQIQEVKTLEMEINTLEERVKTITNLQRNRPEMVHMFDELVQIIPEGVHLVSMKQKDNSLDLHGLAQSNARVSSFMRNIDESKWFGEPQLISIEEDQKTKDASIKFNLKAKHINKAELAAKEAETRKPVVPGVTPGAAPTPSTAAPAATPAVETKP